MTMAACTTLQSLMIKIPSGTGTDSDNWNESDAWLMLPLLLPIMEEATPVLCPALCAR